MFLFFYVIFCFCGELYKIFRWFDVRKYVESNNIEDKLFPQFSEVPNIEFELMGLKREVQIQNTLYAFLTQKYEESKIQEARDTPTIQTLDAANKPEKRYQPKRVLMVIGYSIIMLFLSSIYVIYFTYHQEESSEPFSG